MNDERLLQEVSSWLQESHPAPPDAQQSVQHAMHAMPRVRQRSRWWPIPVLYRKTQVPTASATEPYRPGPMLATNGHTPNAVGRTRSILSPATAITAGAVVLVLGGVLLVAEPLHQGSLPGAETDVTGPTPLVDLGIFEPLAGRVLYCDGDTVEPDLWSIDPSSQSPIPTLAGVGLDCASQDVVPLGFSNDGTKLLFLREDPFPPDRQPPFENLLYILHADGTETEVTPGPVRDAAISPDGTRVAFTARSVPGREPVDEGLFIVDADGGEPLRIAVEGASPTFSSDGMQIAYVSSPPGFGVGSVTDSAAVWVVNVDGTEAHEILADERGEAEPEIMRIAWSPAGDRIAMYRREDGGQEETGAIYTFASDGSNFTKVIAGGFNHHWSPDGSRIAYECLSTEACSLAIADADGSTVLTFDVGAAGPWHPGPAR